MIWDGLLLWDPQISFSANMLFIVFPLLLRYLGVPTVSFSFFCKCCGIPFRWKGWMGYMAAGVILTIAQVEWKLSGIVSLLPEILVFAVCGCILLWGRWVQALAVSVLAASVSNVCDGIAQWLGYWMLWKGDPWIYSIPPCVTLIQETVDLSLLFLILHLFLKIFSQNSRKNDGQVLFLLVIPAFFIALVERIVRDSIYGDTIVTDSERGILFPRIDHGEIFFLQILACACLFLILAAYRKIAGALQAEQTIRLLEQQERAQEVYMQEALSRYRQTRSFRHDIKNHLTVLAGLLKNGQTEQAQGYLENLDQICGSLSYPVQTGNAAVDALLGSKSSAARQQGFSFICDLKLPSQTGILDIDWCIVLANAIDNAVAAGRRLPPDKRYIHIGGKKKGNLYLLSIENPCKETIQGAPKEGIGLANIRAAVERYQGAVKISAADGIFRLDLLWVLPCEDRDPFYNS